MTRHPTGDFAHPHDQLAWQASSRASSGDTRPIRAGGPPGEPEHPQQDPPPMPPRDPGDPGRPQQPELPPVSPHTPTLPEPHMRRHPVAHG